MAGQLKQEICVWATSGEEVDPGLGGHGWWQRLKKPDVAPEPTPNEKLVTYLAAGRNHGYTALRKETRVARNRLILLTLVLIAVLWSILSLLIPQL